MKLLVITLCLIFLILGIQNNNLSSFRNKLKEERIESYEACKKKKKKIMN